MTYAIEATCHRTALLLGLVRGDAVHRWAEAIIASDPAPPAALFDVVSAAATDLSGLRHALWPLVIEPDPDEVLRALIGRLHADLWAGSRSATDTLTVVRQMRSMLRLPREMYDDLNSALAEGALESWLQRYAQSSAS